MALGALLLLFIYLSYLNILLYIFLGYLMVHIVLVTNSCTMMSCCVNSGQ